MVVIHAHKLNVTVSADHEIAIRLPDDFPPGPAEIIVLAVPRASDRPGTAVRTLKPHPVLGKIVFHKNRLPRGSLFAAGSRRLAES